MTSTIFYFSATGNSYDVAREIAGKLGDTQLQSLVPLASGGTVSCKGTVGLVFPVYDWDIPPVVRDFLTRLDMKQADYFYAVATCNYLSGRSLDTIEKILAEKKKKLDAGFVVRMPGTYIPFYGANSDGTQEKKFQQKTKKAESISQYVRDGRTGKLERSSIGIDWLLAPAMAKKVDRIEEHDKDFISEEECSGCGICAKVCPFNNITLENGKPQWLHKCRRCYACIHLCPKSCIQIGNKTKGKRRYRNPNVPLNEIIRIAADKYK